jgi:ribonuclease D
MLVRDRRTLLELVPRLRAAGAFALDTEFLRERTYRPQLCLVQVAVPDLAVAIDPLAVGNLAELVELLLDPGIVKILHAGQQDMEIFFAGRGAVPRNVFDTQIAAALLGYGESIGYSRLVEAVLGTRLSKGETITDWTQRPLTPRQIEYALDDVRHLLALRQRLAAELEELGRMEWLAEELTVYEEAGFYRRDSSRAFERIRGAARLSARELAVLKELAVWREEEAEVRDRPRSRILADELLIELARREPSRVEDIQAVRRIHPELVRRSGKEIVRRVARALASPPETYPRPLERSKDAALAPLVDLLEAFLKARAAELRIAPGYIASRSDLFELARSRLQGASAPEAEALDLPLLKGWRNELVGMDLLAFLEGRSRLAVEPRSGRVEIQR